MGSLIEQGASGFPPTRHHPPTLLSEEGDTSNLASCSLETLINKRAPDFVEIVLFSGGSFPQISPPHISSKIGCQSFEEAEGESIVCRK